MSGVQRCLLSCCCAAALLLVLALFSPARALQILTPADNSYLEFNQVTVAVAIENQAATAVQVSVGTKRYRKELAKGVGTRHACLFVPLERGQNRLELSVLAGATVLERKTMELYVRSAILKPYQKVPDQFRRLYFHQPAAEAACASCHRMEATLYDVTPQKPEDSPCYTCHKNKGEQRRYKHSPFAAGYCLSCHEVVKGKRKYATRKPDQQSCFVCHSAEGRHWKAQKVHHGPTAVGNCTLCHDPHASDWPALEQLHPTELCLNCHNDKKSGAHVIAGFFGKGHPVRAARNPLKQERPFSCAGCHNPHAGKTQSLLNQERENLATYCQNCHKL